VCMSRDAAKQTKGIGKIRQYFLNNVTQKADTAHFVTSYGDDGATVMLYSNFRSDAVILESLMAVDGTKNPLCPMLTKGILGGRKKGRWKSTQENCFVLLALDKYFATYEKNEPDFVATMWVADVLAGEQKFKGRSTDTHQLLVPMSYLQANSSDTTNFILQKQGPGRLYYRIGMSYAPKDLKLKAANYGFKVERVYAGAENAAHAIKLDDGTWKFKLGQKIKVTLTMTTSSRRNHVALVDFLPAGLEPLNSALKGAASGATESSTSRREEYNPYAWRWYDRHAWPEHENLRDERVEAFRTLLWPGVYEFSYFARATTSGSYIMPPAKAEEMYAPDTFGRSATEFAVIDPEQ